MRDFVSGVIFTLCEVTLFALVFSPFLVRPVQTMRTWAIPFPARTFLFGLAAGVFIVTAWRGTVGPGIQPSTLSRPDAAIAAPASSSSPSTTTFGRSATGPKLTAEAFRGKPVVIHYDANACKTYNLGTIQCGVDYIGRYDSSSNRWTVTGPRKGEPGPQTFATDNGERVPGNLSLWGMLSGFDDAGNVLYLDERVGSIRLQSSGEHKSSESGSRK